MSKSKNWKFPLGYFAKDALTNKEFILIARTEHISGCDTYWGVEPGKDNIEYQDIEERRLTLLSDKENSMVKIDSLSRKADDFKFQLGDEVTVPHLDITGTVMIRIRPATTDCNAYVIQPKSQDGMNVPKSYQVDEPLVKLVKAQKVKPKISDKDGPIIQRHPRSFMKSWS